MSDEMTCPYCSAPMANCGAPIWEDYCTNNECTGHRDEFKRRFQENRKAFAAQLQSKEVRDVIISEREACAKVVDTLIEVIEDEIALVEGRPTHRMALSTQRHALQTAAAAIRNRAGPTPTHNPDYRMEGRE